MVRVVGVGFHAVAMEAWSAACASVLSTGVVISVKLVMLTRVVTTVKLNAVVTAAW